MKNSLIIAALGFSLAANAQHQDHGATGYADSVNAGLIAQDTMKKSPHRVSMANIGDAHVHIEYGSPGVRGRTIWGGLVAYDQVWSAGAHNATKISFSKAVTFAGKKIEAGTYGFFLIPHKDNFTVILNKNFNQHLADDYDQKDDVVRMDIAPVAPAKTVQRLTYEVVETGKNQGQVRFSWENKMVKVPVSL
jgi:Ni,Fe-hydrogenase I large subunit